MHRLQACRRHESDLMTTMTCLPSSCCIPKNHLLLRSFSAITFSLPQKSRLWIGSGHVCFGFFVKTFPVKANPLMIRLSKYIMHVCRVTGGSIHNPKSPVGRSGLTRLAARLQSQTGLQEILLAFSIQEPSGVFRL